MIEHNHSSSAQLPIPKKNRIYKTKHVAMSPATTNNERLAALKAFDDTKLGVHGLVTAGVTKVPPIFILPRDLQQLNKTPANSRLEIPVINLAGDREHVVSAVRQAGKEWGFFQVIGHGVPVETMEAMVEAVRAFNEGEDGVGVKEGFYSRDPDKAVKFSSNFDLYKSRVANWRDTLYFRMAPEPPRPEELPETCREAFLEYSKHVQILGNTLFGFFSEALGLNSSYLADMECNQGEMLVGHYYPPCPEPDATIGTSEHSDPSFITVLLQDQIGGLLVFHKDEWVDVTPIPGALVVNVGDLLQLISNDRFSSVEHRVLAKTQGPRVSVACFFRAHIHRASTRLYGPIKELLSDENPPLYQETLVKDYVASYYSRGLSKKSTIENFRL